MSGIACEFAKEHDWTQHTLARDAGGMPCQVDADGAVNFCAMGYIMASYRKVGKANFELDQAITLFRKHLDKMVPKFTYSVSDWNDEPERTKQDVVDALCAADV